MTPRENTELMAEKSIALTETVTSNAKNIFFTLYFFWETTLALRISQLSLGELVTKNVPLVTYHSSLLYFVKQPIDKFSKTKIKPPEFFKEL